MAEVPCLIRQLDDLAMQQQALIENIVREDLNPIEEAVAYEELAKEYGITQDILARALGKSRSAISNTIRLLQLPDTVQDYVRKGELSAGHGRTLLPLSPQEQETTALLIKDKRLSVRETEELVKNILNPPQKKKTKQRINNAYNLHTKKIEDEMTRAMGAKVRIKSRGRAGTIHISYSSPDELERLIEENNTRRIKRTQVRFVELIKYEFREELGDEEIRQTKDSKRKYIQNQKPVHEMRNNQKRCSVGPGASYLSSLVHSSSLPLWYMSKISVMSVLSSYCFISKFRSKLPASIPY